MIAITLFFAVVVSVNSDIGPRPPYNLQCDHNLVGLNKDQLESSINYSPFFTESSHPLLSWSISHTERNAVQNAFRVVLSEDPSFKRSDWDSGKIYSENQSIVYCGPALQRETLYYWYITWWDQYGQSSKSEEIGHFLSVNVTKEDWAPAKWIVSPPTNSVPWFVRQVEFRPFIQKAFLYISGLGFYTVLVNSLVLNSLYNPPIFLSPGWTNYEIRIPYLVYDLHDILPKFESPVIIEIMLGRGWRDTNAYPLHDPSPVPDQKERVLRLILNITYTDGTSSVIYSKSSTWEVLNSSITSDCIYNGEFVNALVPPNELGIATETEGPAGEMYLPTIPNIARTTNDYPINITKLPPNSEGQSRQVVDFQFNTAGIVHLNVAGVQQGIQISIKHAEVPMHPPYGNQDGSLYYGNLRGAKAIDIFTSDGGVAFYQPTFTYHGFRYAEIINYPRDLTTSDIRKVRVNTAVKPNTEFKTSDQLLYNIQQNCLRGQLSNLMSIPTDCSQRDERLGWMGDASLSADSFAINFHMESFFPHWVQLMNDELINGSLPDVVPYYRYGRRPSDPAWGAAYPQTIWVLYKQYGDLKTAQEQFEGLLMYINFMVSKIPSSGIGDLYGSYGDWVPPPPMKKVKVSFTSAFSLLLSIKQVQEIAVALKDTDTATKLDSMYKQYTAEFNKAFLTNGKYVDDLQVSYVLPLYLDILPEEQKEQIVKYFINKLTTTDNTHITAGIIGTKFLLPVLTNLKRNDLALEIVKQVDYPSWGFMIHNPYEPATALWELWNAHNGSAGMDSRNHHMFSSVSGWMQTDMIGFRQSEGSYGYKELDLYPATSLDISSASISIEYPRDVKFSWHRKGGIQCAKSAEDHSSVNPGLPEHGGLKLMCGEGIISKVLFASYGNPKGVCGYYRQGNCHASQTLNVTNKLCLNKTECLVPTSADYWGDPCPGLEIKWLQVAVLCKVGSAYDIGHHYTSLQVNVTVPVGSQAHINIPAYGTSKVMVLDNDTPIFTNGHLLERIKGIHSYQWIPERDVLRLDVLSGEYNLTVTGKMAEESRVVEAKGNVNHAMLKCSHGNVITSIDWVSYGNPSINFEEEGDLGSCHSGTSLMVTEDVCLGKQQCSIPLDVDFFGGNPCPDILHELNFIAKYSCNRRIY